MNLKRLFVSIGIVLFLASPALPQEPASSLENEIKLGLGMRGALLTRRAELTEGPEVEVSHKVFQRLLATSIAKRGDALPYRLTLFSGADVNAFSYAGGQVFAEGGIVQLLKDSPGLWAAVLGHEIGHAELHHHYRAYVRQVALQEQAEYYKRRAAAGDQSANWALIGLGIGGSLLNLKLSRDEELEADRMGMFMMAEAGYHPDFAISCYRRIAFKMGDQSKASAFFADHPRWETREQRALKAYEDALSVFQSRWGEVESSPGGAPPPIASLNNITAEKDEPNKAAIITALLNVRNAKGTEIIVQAEFYHDEKPVPAAIDAIDRHKSRRGYLWAGVLGHPHSSNETTTIEIRVPSAAIGIKQRKLKAYLVVFGPEEEVLQASKEFNVSFPSK
ncbi:MAG: M48 family metalloprotease [Blastocatellia bacterium]